MNVANDLQQLALDGPKVYAMPGTHHARLPGSTLTGNLRFFFSFFLLASDQRVRYG
jgi:hypothetical protein